MAGAGVGGVGVVAGVNGAGAGRSDRVPMDRVLAWAQRHCEDQGVEFKITDPTVIAEVAPLFGAGTDDAAAIASRRA